MEENFRSLLACKKNDTAFFKVSNQLANFQEKSIFYIFFNDQGVPTTLTKANGEIFEFDCIKNNSAFFITNEIDAKIEIKFYGHIKEDCFDAIQSIPFGDDWIPQYIWNFCRIK